MSYQVHNFRNGETIEAPPINEMDAQIQDNAEKIDDLTNRVYTLEHYSGQVGQGGQGMSIAMQEAILLLARKVGYIDSSGADVYQALQDAIFNTASPASVVSITAVLNTRGNAIYRGASLDSLRQYLTVTATYDDQSQRAVTAYYLSGAIFVGENTITVTYDGKTTTFVVVGESTFDLPAEYTPIPSLYSSGNVNAYLDTGVMSGEIDYAEYRIMPMDLRYLKAGHVVCATNHYFPFLTGDNTNGERSRIGFRNKGNDDSSVSSGSYVFPWSFNEAHTLKGFVNGKVYVDGNELFTIPPGSAASSEIRIFCAPDVDRYFVGRLYWLKFYKNGSIYRSYVPCTNSNNVPGLYETVTGTFIYDTNNTGYIRVGGE